MAGIDDSVSRRGRPAERVGSPILNRVTLCTNVEDWRLLCDAADVDEHSVGTWIRRKAVAAARATLLADGTMEGGLGI